MTTTAITATVRTRAYSSPTGQRRIRATSPGRQTSYAWDHEQTSIGNHRSAAEAHGVERLGMVVGGVRAEEPQLNPTGAGYGWTVTDYSFDGDEQHPDMPHVPMHTRIARAKRDREDSNWDFVDASDPDA